MLLETGLVPYSLSSPPGERALVLAPHPDDETFGMGGSLRLLTDAGKRVKVLVLTAGEKADAKIPVTEGRLGLAIADVSGKGIPAALIMAGFRMSLLAEIRNEFAIRAVMRKVNLLLHESTKRDRFVTTFYGLLDWRNGVLTFANAGHNPPLLLRADGTTEALIEGGVALGVLEDARYEERPLAIGHGDILVMYTDGVSEAEDENNEQFGPERIEEIVRANPTHTARQLTQDIVAAVLDWAGPHRPQRCAHPPKRWHGREW